MPEFADFETVPEFVDCCFTQQPGVYRVWNVKFRQTEKLYIFAV